MTTIPSRPRTSLALHDRPIPPRRQSPATLRATPVPPIDGVDQEMLCRKMRRREDRLTVPAGADLRATRVAYRWLVWLFGRTGHVPEWASSGPLRLRIDAGRFDRIREQKVKHVVAECRAVQSAALEPMEYVETVEHLDTDAERARRAAIYARRWECIESRFGGAVDGHAGKVRHPAKPCRPVKRQHGKPATLTFPSGHKCKFVSLSILAAWGGYGLSTVSEAMRDKRRLADGCRVEPADSRTVRSTVARCSGALCRVPPGRRSRSRRSKRT